MTNQSSISELIAEIDAETERIWMDPPADIQRFQHGFFDTYATRGYVFPSMVLICGNVHALCISTTPDLIMKSLRDESFTVEQVKIMFKRINNISIDLFALWGFIRLGELCHRVMDTLDQVETKDELGNLLKSWYAYTHRMGIWIIHVFPWAVGSHLRQWNSEDAQHLAKLAKEGPNIQSYFDQWADELLEWKTAR